MDPLTTNPFAVLTFIAAPAILTNATAVMALSTSNRFARAVDRARTLAADLQGGRRLPDDLARRKVKQLHFANRRGLLLVRALTSFYVSLGGFAAASFTSLLGAVFVIAQHDLPRQLAMLVAFTAGLIGIGGVVFGSAILVFETRLTLAILREETELTIRGLPPERGGTEVSSADERE